MSQQELKSCSGPLAQKQRFISDFGTEQVRVEWNSHEAATCTSYGWHCVKLEVGWIC